MSTNLRTIKAILYRNSMKNAGDKYLARTSVNNVYNIRAVCESACRNAQGEQIPMQWNIL